MSTPWVPPRPTYHLRIFGISLMLVLASLLGFLFGVRLEAIMPATGEIVARDQHDVRAGIAGLIDLGWYEAIVPETKSLHVRLDFQGNGTTDPAEGSPVAVRSYQLADGREVPPGSVKFHKLQAGDEVWPGQVIGRIRSDELEDQLRKLKARLEDIESRGDTGREVLVEYHLTRERLSQGIVRLPQGKDPWLVLKVNAIALQAVQAGDLLVQAAPLDPRTHEPRELLAVLDIHEKHAGDIQPDQPVRLYLSMYNQRLHGHAEGRLQRLEPLGQQGPNGERHFRAHAVIDHCPFALRPGSTCKAEIVVGRKPVYRIILEQ